MNNSSLPCVNNREAFDADFLDPTVYNSALTDGGDVEREKEFLEDAVNDVVEAIQACYNCPLLQECRERTIERINDKIIAPSGIVQAGVYWGYDHRPDWTLNGSVTHDSSAPARERSGYSPHNAYRLDENGKRWPLTVPIFTRFADNSNQEIPSPNGPIDIDLGTWDVAWIPPLPEPINYTAVAIAVNNEDAHNRVIPETKLKCYTSVHADGREVLTDADVCEVVRQLHANGLTVRAIAQRLSLNHSTVRLLLPKLGLPVQYSEKHRTAAKQREKQRRLEKQQEERRNAERRLSELYALAESNDRNEPSLWASILDDDLIGANTAGALDERQVS